MREEGRQKRNSGARDVTARISISLNSQQLPHFVGAKRPQRFAVVSAKTIGTWSDVAKICCLDTSSKTDTEAHVHQQHKRLVPTERLTQHLSRLLFVICTWCVYPPCTDNLLVHWSTAAVQFITNCATSTTGRDLTHARTCTRLCCLLPRTGLFEFDDAAPVRRRGSTSHRSTR